MKEINVWRRIIEVLNVRVHAIENRGALIDDVVSERKNQNVDVRTREKDRSLRRMGSAVFGLMGCFAQTSRTKNNCHLVHI